MSDPDAPRPPRESGAAPASISRTILDWLRSLGGLRGDDLTLRKSLEVLLDDYADEGQPINPDERLMLMNILKLSELEVDDVMVPRADIVAVDAAAAYDEVIEIFRKEFHSRMPVYRETLDEVLGAVYVKDLVVLAGDPQGFNLAAIARPVLCVPPSMPVLALFSEMRTSRIHMAVVVDEYGGTDGLVTIEDLVEEIVGEIEDEHDRVEAPLLVEGPEGSLEADARVPIAELEARLDIALLDNDRDEDIETLGGLLFSLVGRVPRPGERVLHPSQVEFEVVDADARRVKRVRVRAAAGQTASGQS